MSILLARERWPLFYYGRELSGWLSLVTLESENSSKRGVGERAALTGFPARVLSIPPPLLPAHSPNQLLPGQIKASDWFVALALWMCSRNIPTFSLAGTLGILQERSLQIKPPLHQRNFSYLGISLHAADGSGWMYFIPKTNRQIPFTINWVRMHFLLCSKSVRTSNQKLN